MLSSNLWGMKCSKTFLRYPLDEVVQYNVSVTVFVRYDPSESSRRNLQDSQDPSRRKLQAREDGGKHIL